MEHCISSTCIENVLLTEIIYHFQSTVLARKLNFLAVGASVTEVICIFVSKPNRAAFISRTLHKCLQRLDVYAYKVSHWISTD